MEILLQMYDTDRWGSHASRKNLGVFSSVERALYSLVKNPTTGEYVDTARIISIFEMENRLFIEAVIVDDAEGYSQAFDSDKDDCLNELKRIIFFETTEMFKNDLGFLDIDTDTDIDFDINEITCVEDVTDDLIEIYLSSENAVQFMKANFTF